jgi:3-oxoadipate enol-lactonase
MEHIPVRGITDIAADVLRNDGELIVFIHGVGADRTSWKYQLPFFHEKGYSVAALDMRGSGDSPSRDVHHNMLPISLNEFAKDVDAAIKALGYEKAHWIGNSMGGVIILEAIRSGLPSIDRIGLCNTFAYYPEHEATLPRAKAALEVKSLPDFAAERIPFVLRPDIDKPTLDEAIHAMARKDPEAYLASWQATWSPDFRLELGQIKNKTLVVSGSLDKITPVALSEELEHHIPGAKQVTIDGAGHISNLDQPEQFNNLLFEFLQETK